MASSIINPNKEEFMKNKSKLILSAVALFGAAISLSGCNSTSTSSSGGTTAVKTAVEAAQKMSREDLYKKAAEELKNGGVCKFDSVTSRLKKGLPSFVTELQKYEPSVTADNFKIDTAVDGVIYTTLLGEIESGSTSGYSGAIVQDSYQLQKKGIDTGYFVNYTPKDWTDATDTDKTNDANPFSLQYNFKTWMVNNGNGDTTTLDNVWDITAAKYKGKIQTMDPRNENVNMDWLIMLTKDKWCDSLKSAFEDASNDNSSLDLSKYESYGAKKKYAYAFIDGYLTNSVFYADDGKARDAFDPASAGGNLAWIVYSKIASITETAAVTKKNITIGALGKNNTDGNSATMQMKGFGGFMYKHYPQIMPNAPYPYAACAFIDFLSTTEAGYHAWATDIGDYPTMSSINLDRTKYGHGTLTADYKWTQSDTGDNVFPCLNDPKSSWWTSATGGNAVIEEPAYVATQYNAVMAFINTILASK
jgi:hypothetical protein